MIDEERTVNFTIPHYDEDLTIEEVAFLNSPEGTYPPGMWVSAGRFLERVRRLSGG
jgi:hypothetical protein